MFTTVKQKLARLWLVGTIVFIAATTQLIPVVYADPVCGSAVTGC